MKLTDKGKPLPQLSEKSQEHHGELSQISADIGKHVMLSLGQPSNLYRVQVRQLWEDRFRINVYVGADLASAKVAHSFFLKIDSEGQIVSSSPRITRQYA